jgi:hypothetical protein
LDTDSLQRPTVEHDAHGLEGVTRHYVAAQVKFESNV